MMKHTNAWAMVLMTAVGLMGMSTGRANVGNTLLEVYECTENTLEETPKPQLLTILHYDEATAPDLKATSKIIYESGQNARVVTGSRFRVLDNFFDGSTTHYTLNQPTTSAFDVSLKTGKSITRIGTFRFYEAVVVLGAGSVSFNCDLQLKSTPVAVPNPFPNLPNHR